jgi:hypothetical protein
MTSSASVMRHFRRIDDVCAMSVKDPKTGGVRVAMRTSVHGWVSTGRGQGRCPAPAPCRGRSVRVVSQSDCGGTLLSINRCLGDGISERCARASNSVTFARYTGTILMTRDQRSPIFVCHRATGQAAFFFCEVPFLSRVPSSHAGGAA